VRVRSTVDGVGPPLRSSLSGYAKIRSEPRPLVFAFTRRLLRFLQIETWSWLP
jgi:putative peptide zinc metalloprotease protein